MIYDLCGWEKTHEVSHLLLVKRLVRLIDNIHQFPVVLNAFKSTNDLVEGINLISCIVITAHCDEVGFQLASLCNKPLQLFFLL